MISKFFTVRSLTLCLTLAFLAGATQVVLPKSQAEDPMGLLTVTGMVKVNGKPAATGDIIASGSLVETAAMSSAVVSLGKLGRVEATAETKMTLRYGDNNIGVLLDAGIVKVNTGEGVTATIKRNG
jgi:hypothetical protein